MRVFKRGAIWYGWVYENGQRIQRSTRCTDRRAAESVVAQWERAAADPDSAAADQATLGQAITLLLNDRAARAALGQRSMETVGFYKRKSGYLLRHFTEQFRLARMNAGAVDEYIVARAAEGASSHTLAKELTTLRAALKLAARAGTWRGSIDAVMPVRFSAAYKPRERALTEAELDDLLRELEPDRAARVAFIVATSARRGESDRAMRADIIDETRAFVRGTKTAQSKRMVPVVLPACQRLLAFAAERGEGGGGMLFTPWPNMVRDLKAACARAEMDPCSANDLRRTFGHWHRMRGVAPVDIGAAMGHTTSAMVERVYGKLPVEALEQRIALSSGTVAPVQQTLRTGVDSVDSSDSKEAVFPEDLCRQSDLNRRPWDYDAQRRSPPTCREKRRKRKSTEDTVAPVQQVLRRA